jgi:hypothetical protein
MVSQRPFLWKHRSSVWRNMAGSVPRAAGADEAST